MRMDMDQKNIVHIQAHAVHAQTRFFTHPQRVKLASSKEERDLKRNCSVHHTKYDVSLFIFCYPLADGEK